MSVNFKFDLAGDGYTLLETFERYNKHKKQVKIWIKDSIKIAELTLTQGKTTIIDFDKLDDVCQYNWFSQKRGVTGYAGATSVNTEGKHTLKLLHQLLSGVGFGYGRGCKIVCNHLNRDYPDSYELDNRMVNLEVTSNIVNNRDTRMQSNNTTGEDSISWEEKQKLYRVRIAVDNKWLYQPSFSAFRYGSKESALEEAKVIRDYFKCILHDNVNGKVDDKTCLEVDKIVKKYKQGTFYPNNRREKIVLELLVRYDYFLDTTRFKRKL